MISRTLAALALVAALAACGSDGDTGPEDLAYTLGIVDGNGQVVEAGVPELPEPVTARLVSVKLADGSMRFQLVRSLYAQTPVNGSPVPGAVVCSEPPEGVGEDGHWLRPKVRCTNTDENGDAVFTYIPPTVAGEVRTYVRGTVNDQVVDLDSVTAVVEPGAPVAGFWLDECVFAGMPGDTMDLSSERSPMLFDAHGNGVPWKFASMPGASLYTVREPDSMALIVPPAPASGIDSVQVIVDGEVLRMSHVYVRVPETGSNVAVYNWPADRTCPADGVPQP